MPGYFIVETSQNFAVQFTVHIEVTSIDGFKGYVTMAYTYDDDFDTPISITPTSRSVQVGANGVGTDDVVVYVNTGEYVRIKATGTWNDLKSEDTEDLDAGMRREKSDNALEKNRGKPGGFTVVELLVVIAILSLLIGLLLPALSAAREISRLTQCAHNLRQIGLGVITHSTVHGHFPAGGWGYRWTGDPDRGFGAAQPGGWIYNILPYLEQQPTHDLGRGFTAAQKRSCFAQRAQVILPQLYCPTRRGGLMQCDVRRGREPYNQAPVELVARNDYAGNMGDKIPSFGFPPGPTSFVFTDQHASSLHPAYVNDPSYRPYYVDATGVFFLIRFVRSRDVVDGLSNTYLAGEKYLETTNYTTGLASGDDQNVFVGGDRDIFRFATGSQALRRDKPGLSDNVGFGSPHQAGVNMLLCDGSVHRISFAVDFAVHRRSANRMDQQSNYGY